MRGDHLSQPFLRCVRPFSAGLREAAQPRVTKAPHNSSGMSLLSRPRFRPVEDHEDVIWQKAFDGAGIPLRPPDEIFPGETRPRQRHLFDEVEVEQA